MSKVTTVKTRPAVSVEHCCRWRDRLLRRAIRAGVHCRLADDASVTLFSGDLAVRVETPRACITTAYDGSMSGTCTKCGARFHAATASLYLAAADRQGIPVNVAAGAGRLA